MRLIGAGLPRTGTLSQKVALEMLGLTPCYHMVNVLMTSTRPSCGAGRSTARPPWDEVFDGFQATVDWPGSFFYKELVECVPGRQGAAERSRRRRWERSMRDTIWGLFYGDMLIRDLSHRPAPRRLEVARIHRDDGGDVAAERPDRRRSRTRRPESMRSAMERFNEGVQQNVPADRLLVWSVSDGWEPLCEFLELPVPDTPFPHLNDSKEFGERIVDGSLLALQEWRSKDAPPVATT